MKVSLQFEYDDSEDERESAYDSASFSTENDLYSPRERWAYVLWKMLHLSYYIRGAVVADLLNHFCEQDELADLARCIGEERLKVMLELAKEESST